MTNGEYIMPNEYDIPDVNNDVSAQYCEAPEHAGRDLEDIDLNQYWDQPPDDRGRMIDEGMGPGPEINTEQPQESEIAGSCDPPENDSVGTDLNE